MVVESWGGGGGWLYFVLNSFSVISMYTCVFLVGVFLYDGSLVKNSFLKAFAMIIR